MKLVVDPPELRKASKKFTQFASNYTTVYNRLINNASNMGEAWKAADNLAFVEQINGFCDDLKAMTDHIEQAAQALEQLAVKYENKVTGNITVIKQLTN